MTTSECVIKFKKLSTEAIIPTRATSGAIGYDLYAIEDTILSHDAGIVKIRTGIAVQVPGFVYGRIAPRSGTTVREHFAVSAGVIDKDYRGDIIVCGFCVKPGHSFVIKKGERFAQLVPELAYYGEAIEVTEFKDKVQAEHLGWGSTGI